MVAKGENVVTVSLAGLAAGGACVGDVRSPAELEGKKAFVPFAVPGELVQARIVRNKKSYIDAELVSVLSPSEHRVPPPCPAFGACGGCDLQHIELGTQRVLKSNMVESLLRTHGGVEATDGLSVLGADLPGFRYRRRMSFHINKKGEFGLYRKHGRSIVELSHCPIATDAINDFLAENIALLRGCAPEIETVTVEDHGGVVYVALEVHPRNGNALDTLLLKESFLELERRAPHLRVHYRHRPIYPAAALMQGAPPVGHFSQNNEAANALMLEHIASLIQTEAVTDLFAGAGNISIPLAAAGHRVTAVELDPALVSFGRERAQQAGVSDRLVFHSMSCEKWVSACVPDASVVLDPPRGGALEVCQRLNSEHTRSVVYVSCYPPTFARDVQALCERGYRLSSVRVLDMFPQTYHSELVALIEAA